MDFKLFGFGKHSGAQTVAVVFLPIHSGSEYEKIVIAESAWRGGVPLVSFYKCCFAPHNEL